MDNVFPTELPTSRDVESQNMPRKSYVIPPLPLIEKKISNFAPPKQNQVKFKPKNNPTAKTTKIRKHHGKKNDLHPETKFILAHPTQLPQTIQQIDIVEKQLKALFEKHAASNEFEEAGHVQRILNSLSQKKRALQANELPVIKDENKKQELILLVDNYIENWNKSLENFMDATDKQAALLFDTHQREIEEFDDNVPKKLTVQFKKPSSELLDMRRTEQKCALQHRYNKAIKLKNEADQLELKEGQNQMKKMKAYYFNKRQNLRQKQDDQMKIFFEHAEATRTKMIAMRDKMIDGYMNRMKLIDENIDNYCQQTSMKKEDIPEQFISKERMKRVKKAEKFPIPQCRPGTSFTNARRKLYQY